MLIVSYTHIQHPASIPSVTMLFEFQCSALMRSFEFIKYARGSTRRPLASKQWLESVIKCFWMGICRNRAFHCIRRRLIPFDPTSDQCRVHLKLNIQISWEFVFFFNYIFGCAHLPTIRSERNQIAYRHERHIAPFQIVFRVFCMPPAHSGYFKRIRSCPILYIYTSGTWVY